jgi:hypothetical protein
VIDAKKLTINIIISYLPTGILNRKNKAAYDRIVYNISADDFREEYRCTQHSAN